jgi:hypothetical protein
VTIVKSVAVYCTDLHKLKFISFTICTETEECQGSKTASVYLLKPLTPELNLSAQRCLTRFFNGDFDS